MTLPYFNIFRDFFYIELEGKSQNFIPSNISELVTLVALAFLIMSEGFYSNRDGYVGLAPMISDMKILNLWWMFWKKI